MEESGWKMVSGDVFRPPKNAILLCVQIGSGVQIITSAFATLFFAALGECSFSNTSVIMTQPWSLPVAAYICKGVRQHMTVNLRSFCRASVRYTCPSSREQHL